MKKEEDGSNALHRGGEFPFFVPSTMDDRKPSNSPLTLDARKEPYSQA